MSVLSDKRRLALIFVLVAVLAWFAKPGSDATPALVQARQDRWALPELPVPSDRTTQALQVAASPIWGPDSKKDKSAENAPPPDPRWRLAGVFGSGKVGGALVLFEDPAKAPQRLKVGERLPSGHVIEAVDGNQVCIRIGKQLYRFGVERRE